PFDRLPAQTISKRVASNADEDESNDISLGDTLTYAVLATNSGNTTLTNVVVTDEKLNPTTITCASVAPQATCELAGTYTVTQADIDAGEILNNAQVVSDEIDEPTKTTLETPVEQKPAITLEKRLAEEQEADYAVGDTIGFEIVATNTGNQTLTSVTINDSMITPAEKVCETVAPSETCVLAGSYTVTQADKDAGEITNEATVTSDQTPLPKKAVLTTGLVQNRKPTLTKTLASHLDKDEDNTISVGDILSFEVTLLNDGDITLTQVNVKDNKISPSSQSCPRIEPGESCVLKGTYKVTQADVDAGSFVNKAEATMKEVPEGRIATLTTPIPQAAAMTLVKNALEQTDVDDNGAVSVGDLLSYEVKATNTGNVTLLNVVIQDAKLTPNSKTCETLAPGADCLLEGTLTLTQADIDAGAVDNVASASADNLSKDLSAEETVTLEQNSKPTLSKVLSNHNDKDGSESITIGDELTYTVTLLNDGNTTVTDAVVTDSRISPSSKTCTTLLPGQACELVGT
ncbi:MAG: hypothetical protein VW799_07750, partial [Halieaceae bacterium]